MCEFAACLTKRLNSINGSFTMEGNKRVKAGHFKFWANPNPNPHGRHNPQKEDMFSICRTSGNPNGW